MRLSCKAMRGSDRMTETLAKIKQKELHHGRNTVCRSEEKEKMVAWYVCGGIVVLCIAAFFVYQKGVEILLRRQMENLWANNFSMESISFDPWTSTVELKKMVWKNPHQYSKGGKAITVDEGSANLNAWALFRHVVHFEEVKVRNVALNFEFRKDPTRITDLLSMFS